ncbi:unnamed protein product [Mytilus edulis]|uniref:Uncharacterized protein n=1 Tax=Mytilus edulis TaxID=6550 RepID=A0A8S3UX77_MYTED|nr:unnamed protein product [Mytilus edulis]
MYDQTNSDEKTAFGFIKDWLRQQGESIYFEDMLPLYLNSFLTEFYQTCVRSGLPSNILEAYPSEISRYLNNPPFNRNIDIETHPEFISSSQILRSWCHNFDVSPMAAPDDAVHRPISDEDLQLLYRSPCMSCDTPEGLQNKVWVDVNLYFGVLSRKMLRQLEKSSFILEVDYDNDRRYYRIADEKIPKDRHMSRMYEQPGNQLCPVQSMLHYYSRLNPSSEAFFQQPDKSGVGSVWYNPTPVGKNVHSGKLSTICRPCGIKLYYRNTALRAVYRRIHAHSPDYTFEFSKRILKIVSGREELVPIQNTEPLVTYDGNTSMNFEPSNSAAMQHLNLTLDLNDPAGQQFRPVPVQRSKPERGKQRPGPRPTMVRLKFYFLPDWSKLPSLSKLDPLIQTHQDQGFGYPAHYYNREKMHAKPWSWNLDLSDEDFKESIRDLYPLLEDKDFTLYTVDQNKRLRPVPFKTAYFKAIKYQGTVIIKMNESGCSDVSQTSQSGCSDVSQTSQSGCSDVSRTSQSGCSDDGQTSQSDCSDDESQNQEIVDELLKTHSDGMEQGLFNFDQSLLPPYLRRSPKEIPGVTRLKMKPGPQPSSYRMKLYLLPPGSKIPKLSKNDPIIQTHQEQGYGYPARLYAEGKVRVSWDITLSEQQFKETIRATYPILRDKDFSLVTIDQQRLPKPVPFNLQYFKQVKYNGTVFIVINE